MTLPLSWLQLGIEELVSNITGIASRIKLSTTQYDPYPFVTSILALICQIGNWLWSGGRGIIVSLWTSNRISGHSYRRTFEWLIHGTYGVLRTKEIYWTVPSAVSQGLQCQTNRQSILAASFKNSEVSDSSLNQQALCVLLADVLESPPLFQRTCNGCHSLTSHSHVFSQSAMVCNKNCQRV